MNISWRLCRSAGLAILAVFRTNHRIMTRPLSIGFACWLTGCAELQLGYNVLTYDTAIADTSNQLLLLNAVRASQHYPMSFTSVGQVLASPPISGGLQSTLNFTSMLGLSTYSLNPSVNATAGYSGFVLDNLNFQKFMESIRRPLPQKIEESIIQRTNWPRELVNLIYLQRLLPPALLAKSIDDKRKYICTNPRLDRDRKLCNALNENIDVFTSHCSNHFNDVRERMSDLHEDQRYYYNTAITYCHFERFKIFLEEMRLIGMRPCPSEKPAAGCVPATHRSPLEMIYYLGELIAAQNYIETPFTPLMLFGSSTESGNFEFVPVPVFIVKRGGVGPEGAAVSVYHHGDIYYIPLPDFGSPAEARSLQVLDLILQTVRAATLRDDLPKLPTFGILTKQ